MNITAAGTAEIATEEQPHGHGHAQGSLAKLMVGAVGIVFGDIGTSPIYAFRETFAGHHTLVPDALHIYGVLSLIFWSMLIIVALKYVTIIMRADNKGEGGSLALLALINRTAAEGEKKKWTMGIVMLGVFATALFYGDSMITPAISVLSAVEGLTTVQAGFAPYVIPTAIGILVGLFAIQSRGTAKVGLLFGPIMLVYFVTIAVLGGMHIVKHPAVFVEMFNPLNAFKFYFAEPLRGLHRHGQRRPGGDRRRGALCRHGPFRPPPDQVQLALLRHAGAAAQLYGAGRDAAVADPGRGARDGQESLLLPRARSAAPAAGHPRDAGDDHRQPGGDFGRLLGHPAGDPARLHPAPSGSPTPASMPPGRSTSRSINWALMVMVILLVLIFGSSSNLAAAYGIAVTGAMLIDGVLIAVVLFTPVEVAAVEGGAAAGHLLHHRPRSISARTC